MNSRQYRKYFRTFRNNDWTILRQNIGIKTGELFMDRNHVEKSQADRHNPASQALRQLEAQQNYYNK